MFLLKLSIILWFIMSNLPGFAFLKKFVKGYILYKEGQLFVTADIKLRLFLNFWISIFNQLPKKPNHIFKIRIIPLNIFTLTKLLKMILLCTMDTVGLYSSIPHCKWLSALRNKNWWRRWIRCIYWHCHWIGRIICEKQYF